MMWQIISLIKFDQYKQDIDTFYDNIMEKNG